MNFGSGWNSAQHEVLNGASSQKEMKFNVPLPGNTRRLVKNFTKLLLEVAIIVKNLQKSNTW
jgi:hypothetical protein